MELFGELRVPFTALGILLYVGPPRKGFEAEDPTQPPLPPLLNNEVGGQGGGGAGGTRPAETYEEHTTGSDRADNSFSSCCVLGPKKTGSTGAVVGKA